MNLREFEKVKKEFKYDPNSKDPQLYIFGALNDDDFEGLGNYDDLKNTAWDPSWYRGFCSLSETKRAMYPKTPKDYLLRKRIEIIADNTRYSRVFITRKLKHTNYSLDSYFQTSHYNRVLKCLSKEDFSKCSEITYGDIFTNDVNGCAWSENNYKYVSVNYSTKFFINFCNLAFLDFETDVPPDIRFAAAVIATRIFLNTEALDFDLDPRGKIKKNIMQGINTISQFELQFIAGHEFSHHLCNHLQDNNFVEKKFYQINKNCYSAKIYNENQKHEFEADINSITRPIYSKNEYNKVFMGALIWFISLNFAEQVNEVINPTDPSMYKSHPSAKDRYNNILNKAKIPDNLDYSAIKRILTRAEILTEKIKEEISIDFDKFDFYGSVYLSEPNTLWRGKELRDRIDF